MFIFSQIGFSAMETVSHLKLIDAGVSKYDITLIVMLIGLIKVFLPLVVTRFTSSSKPMSLYMILTPVRYCYPILIISIFFIDT